MSSSPLQQPRIGGNRTWRVQRLCGAVSSHNGGDGTAVAGGGDDTAVAGDSKDTTGVEMESTSIEIVPLSASLAEEVHQVQAIIAGLKDTIENLRALGSLRGVHSIEAELKKQLRISCSVCPTLDSMWIPEKLF